MFADFFSKVDLFSLPVLVLRWKFVSLLFNAKLHILFHFIGKEVQLSSAKENSVA